KIRVFAQENLFSVTAEASLTAPGTQRRQAGPQGLGTRDPRGPWPASVPVRTRKPPSEDGGPGDATPRSAATARRGPHPALLTFAISAVRAGTASKRSATRK